jgi:hypothetical protein
MSNNGTETFEIQYQECEGYLHAFIKGKKDSVAAALEYWQCVIDECKRRGFRALLVEEDFPNQLSTVDIFTITSAIPGMGSTGLKIAFVDRKAEHNELNLFGESVAVNRGVFGRVFPTLEEAAAWLRS